MGRDGVRRTQLRLLDKGHLTARIESWAASGARNNLVYGYPLLERHLMEFVLGLSSEQFINGGRSRNLMRNALIGILPPKVQWNPSKLDWVRSLECFSISTIF